MIIYSARITRVGPYVPAGLQEQMLITFAADGPADCLDYALALSPHGTYRPQPVIPGNRLTLGGQSRVITAVGQDASQALFSLGHLTLIFDAGSTPRHRGALHLTGDAPAPGQLHGDLMIVEAS